MFWLEFVSCSGDARVQIGFHRRTLSALTSVERRERGSQFMERFAGSFGGIGGRRSRYHITVAVRRSDGALAKVGVRSRF